MFFFLFSILNIYAQTYVHYVSTSGSDSSSCGTQDVPCATINQIFSNYPRESFTLLISPGTYNTTSILLEKDVFIVFQGLDNPLIGAVWRNGTFITNTELSSVEFHDLSIDLIGNGGGFFVSLNASANFANFFNVILSYSGFTSGFLVNMYSGSLLISNITLNGASLEDYFVYDRSEGDETNITVTGSTFTNLNLAYYSGLIVFEAFGAANILIDSNTFTNVTAGGDVIMIIAKDLDEYISIKNNVFVNVQARMPSVFLQNDYLCTILVDNCTWENVSSEFVAGALEAVGYDDANDHNITLNRLSFTNCSGPYSGGLFVAYNSLNLSNSVFVSNIGQYANAYANDVVQGLDRYSATLSYNVTNSTSTSTAYNVPKAVVWNMDTNYVVDISDQLPDPSSSSSSFASLSKHVLSTHLTRDSLINRPQLNPNKAYHRKHGKHSK